jgi:hypothetical protein
VDETGLAADLRKAIVRADHRNVVAVAGLGGAIAIGVMEPFSFARLFLATRVPGQPWPRSWF